MTVYYGRQVSAPETDFGYIAAGQMRGCVFNKTSGNLWVRRIGVYGGKYTGTNATIRLGIYSTDGSMAPLTLMAYTATMTASTVMDDVTGGAVYEGNVAYSINSPVQTSVRLLNDKRYGVFVLATGASFGHSMIAAARISADNENFYDRSGLASYPDPAGASGSVQGHLSIWLVAELNVAPEQPASGLAPVGSINTLVPTFTADFRDKNGAYGTSSGLGLDVGDRLKLVQIEVYRSSDNLLMWSHEYNASGAEEDANAISTAYGGSALSRGTTYKWRLRMSDRFDEWSAWSAYQEFTPASLGFVTVDDTMTPTGKQEAITGLTFQGKWNHQDALSTNAVEVRVKLGGTVVRTSSTIAKVVASSAAPGTLFSVTWADTGFADLAWGQSYTYEIRGRDSNNVWSEWSDGGSFSTNATPSIPTSLVPSGGSVYTSYPKLEFSMTDADDTTATGLTATIRITRPDAGTVDVTAVYNATSGKWEYETTGTELDEYGTFSWRATGYDGTTYSGGATSLGSATWSSAATFQYLTGPTVTMDSPADNATLSGSAVLVQWTASAQAKYRVEVWNDARTERVYDSGTIVDAVSTSHQVPSGFLRNETAYDVILTITDGSDLQGTDAASVTTSYTAPGPLTGVMALPTRHGPDPVPASITLYWDPITVPTAKFRHISIWREAGGDSRRLLYVRNPALTSFVDNTPPSGVACTYKVRVAVFEGADEVESTEVEVTASVTLAGPVLTSVEDGASYRASLLYVSALQMTRKREEAMFIPLAGKIDPATSQRLAPKPVTIRGTARWREFAGVFDLVTNSWATAQEQWEALDALDATDQVVCLRDDRGVRMFGRIVDLVLIYAKPQRYRVQLSIREEDYIEGVA